MRPPNRSAHEQALENGAQELRVGRSLRASHHRVFKIRILIPVPCGQDELKEEDERHLADDQRASGAKEVSDILVGHVSLENHGAGNEIGGDKFTWARTSHPERSRGERSR